MLYNPTPDSLSHHTQRNKTMKSSTMIDHTSPTPIKAHKTSLPISRTSGPGYERPERARTSHACEPCRERKTKCDGERPSCRRCLHTGTGCHYGYGKGWRKRKTAEDLSTTSKKLQQYEALLNDISPMVSVEVRALIDEVRQDIPISSTSETNDSTASPISSTMTTMSTERERSGSGPNTRLPLNLPIPGGIGGAHSRSQPLSFDRVSKSTSPHMTLHPQRETTFEEISTNRLPSITPNGVLIESGARDTSPPYSRPGLAPSHPTTEHFLSSTGSSYGSGSPKKHADDWARSNASSTFGLNESLYHKQAYKPLPTRLTV